jgi:hypothetical protein
MRLSQYKPECNPMISPWRIIAVNEAPIADEVDAAEIAEHIDHGRFSSSSLGDHLVFGSLRTVKTRIERRAAKLSWERRRNLARERLAEFDIPGYRKQKQAAERRKFDEWFTGYEAREHEKIYRRKFVLEWRAASKEKRVAVLLHLAGLFARLKEQKPPDSWDYEACEAWRRKCEVAGWTEEQRTRRAAISNDLTLATLPPPTVHRNGVSFNEQDIKGAEYLFEISKDWPMETGVYYGEGLWYVQINMDMRLRIKGPFNYRHNAEACLARWGFSAQSPSCPSPDNGGAPR